MQIVISTEPGVGRFLEKQAYIMKMIVEECSSRHPDHQFYLVHYNQLKNERWPARENVHIISLPVVSKGPFYKWRCRNKINVFIKKKGAEILLSFNSYLLQRKNVSQYNFIYTLPSKKIKHIQLAKGIIASSESLKEKLINEYQVPGQKILVAYGGADSKGMMSEEDKVFVKGKYVEEKEFFLCRMNLARQENIIQVLKAFSLFKKRQKTSMKLILTGEAGTKKKQFESLINTYKYKDEVVVLHELDLREQSQLLRSAYAVLFVEAQKWNVLSELDIISAGVPLLTASSSVLKEISGDAALYFDLTDAKDIADKLMLIYKDETLRGRVIEEGHKITAQYNWPLTTELVWQLLKGK